MLTNILHMKISIFHFKININSNSQIIIIKPIEFYNLSPVRNITNLVFYKRTIKQILIDKCCYSLHDFFPWFKLLLLMYFTPLLTFHFYIYLVFCWQIQYLYANPIENIFELNRKNTKFISLLVLSWHWYQVIKIIYLISKLSNPDLMLKWFHIHLLKKNHFKVYGGNNQSGLIISGKSLYY